jgi:DNA-binding SARP family transcriptional activator
VLDFRILGPLEVADAAGPLELGDREQRLLLARLLIEPGRLVAFDRLIDALGSDEDVDAIARLRARLSELQRILGPDVLEEGHRGCRLRVRPGQIDVDRFRVLIETADSGSPAARRQQLRHALALWRGPPLADFADAPFAQALIAELDELRVSTEARLRGES